MAKPDVLDLPCTTNLNPTDVARFSIETAPVPHSFILIGTRSGEKRTRHFISKDQARELFNWLGAKLHQ